VDYRQSVEVIGIMLGLTPILLGSNDLLNTNCSCKYKQLTALGRHMLKIGLFKIILNFARIFISSDFCTKEPLIEVLNIFHFFFFPFCRENLYSSTLGGGVATSPMLIVFHGKYSAINPMWHIRHLGKFNFPPSAAGTNYK